MIALRSAVLYLILVGIPVMVMWAVLRFGQNLQAPASFAGRWQVAASPGPACSRDSFQLIIEQSGPNLQIMTAEGERMDGQVTRGGFTAEGPDNLRLKIRRLQGGDSAQFEGIADGMPCDGGSSTLVRATRLGLPRDLTGH